MNQEAAAQLVGPQVEPKPDPETVGYVQPVENHDVQLAKAATEIPGAQTVGEQGPFTQQPTGEVRTPEISSLPASKPKGGIREWMYVRMKRLAETRPFREKKKLEQQHAA